MGRLRTLKGCQSGCDYIAPDDNQGNDVLDGTPTIPLISTDMYLINNADGLLN
jgi:hypothetical protein